MRLQLTQVTIPASGSVSSAFAMHGAVQTAIHLPGLAQSAQAFLQASFQPQKTAPTSANFFRVGKLDGTGDFTWNVAASDAGLSAEVLRGFAWGRVEIGVPNRSITDIRTLSITQQF